MGLVLGIRPNLEVIEISVGDKKIFLSGKYERGQIRIMFEGSKDFVIKRKGTIDEFRKQPNAK